MMSAAARGVAMDRRRGSTGKGFIGWKFSIFDFRFSIGRCRAGFLMERQLHQSKIENRKSKINSWFWKKVAGAR
jgi:hypothetical protein